jgi:PIN domain nuclease of toxin-antitoxin system
VAILLDTCALLWLYQGAPLAPAARRAIQSATRRGQVHVSAVNAWEVGILASTGRVTIPTDFWERVLSSAGVAVAELTPQIAFDSSFLPGEFHRDPADRMLVATARHYGLALITRDARILAYARQGHLRAVRC